jgi:hypothetical protein
VRIGQNDNEEKEQNRKKRKTQSTSPLEGTDDLVYHICAEQQRFYTHVSHP